MICLVWSGIVCCGQDDGESTRVVTTQPELLQGKDDIVSTEQYQYVATRISSGVEFSRATHRFDIHASGGIDATIHWVFTETGVEGAEQSLLSKDYAVISAHIVVKREDSDYTVSRTGNTVHLTGLFRGEKVDKSFTVDEYPLYTNPTVGLKGFILSGRNSSRFWLLRPDRPDILHMKVKFLDDEQIELNGRRVSAKTVKWGLTGIKSLFFSEVYWFSKTSGIFLKNISRRNGIVTELVSGTKE